MGGKEEQRLRPHDTRVGKWLSSTLDSEISKYSYTFL